MARNEEKAQSMLYRFRTAMASELQVNKPRERRPHDLSTVTTTGECDKWQRDLMKTIVHKVGRIQIASGLNDNQIRDLNDQINNLFGEWWKFHRRAEELSGRRIKTSNPLEKRGKLIPNSPKKYRYYGRACNLPGVRELLEVDDQPIAPSLNELWKHIDVNYYGYCDEEDGELVEYEEKLEKELAEKTSDKHGMTKKEEKIAEELRTLDVPIPSQEEIQQYLVEKQQILLEKERQRVLDQFVPKNLQQKT